MTHATVPDSKAEIKTAQRASLRAVLTIRPLLPEAGLALLHELLFGMDAAHEQGVAHGDFTPDNVVVDPSGRCRITGCGTPVSPASDVYAAAAVFFECLTGTQPLHGTVNELYKPVPLDDLPAPVRPLVQRAMSLDPQDRYPDARTFAADVDAVANETYGREWLAHGLRSLVDAVEITISARPLRARDGLGVLGMPWRVRRQTRLAAVGLLVIAALVVMLLFVLNGNGMASVVREPIVEALVTTAGGGR